MWKRINDRSFLDNCVIKIYNNANLNLKEQIMFCTHCGKEINDDAIVCVHCGCAVGKSQASGIKVGKSGKSKMVAGLLGILLGDFGVHDFYMGNIGAGIASVLFFWTGIPGIVGLIKGIIYLCETDEQFESRFNK